MFSNGELGSGWTVSDVMWCALGVPAILAWVAVGLAWLLEPHLAVEAVDPMVWALWGAGLWYGLMVLILDNLMILIVCGWLALLFLASIAP